MTSSMKGGFLRDDTTGALIVQGLNDRDNGQAGIACPSGLYLSPTSSRAIGAGPNTWFGRCVPSRRMTIIRIGFLVTVAAALDDPCAVGIFSATGVLMGSSPSTLGQLNSLGPKSINLSVATVLEPGLPIYGAFSSPTPAGAGATLAGVQGPGSGAPGMAMFGAAIPQADGGFVSAHPMPADMTGFNSGSYGAMPFLTLRES